MSRRRHSAEQIIPKLSEAEVLIAKGQSVSQTASALDITDQMYCRWRKEYGDADRPGPSAEKPGAGELTDEKANVRAVAG